MRMPAALEPRTAGAPHSSNTPAGWERPSVLVRLSVTLALLAGIGEAGLVGFARFGLGRYMHVNPQLVWMAPLSFTLVFVCATLIVILFGRRLTGTNRLGIVAFVCAFVAGMSFLFMLARLHRIAVVLLAAGMAVQFARMSVKHGELVQRLHRVLLGPSFAFVVALALALNGWYALSSRMRLPAPPPPGTPNVLLIIWDTVRAANLSLYGYARSTTPRLERFAEGAITFDNAFAPAPWTLPSHASAFTGRLPDELSSDWDAPLDDAAPTLAEVLRARGYRTAGFVANLYYASRESGLDRGFMRYDDYPLTAEQLLRSTTLGRRLLLSRWLARKLDTDIVMELKRADAVTDAALDWIGHDSGRPFFAFVNAMDAHDPYRPPPPYDGLFGTRVPRWRKPFGNGRPLTNEERQIEIDAYDGGIAYVDAQFGRMIDALERRGMLENTIVVVTSDHGEEFGEHGAYMHAKTLYDRSLHVPLVIAPAGRVPRALRVDRWVSLRDLAATIVALTGTGEGHPLAGESLVPTWSENGGDASSPPQPVVASVTYHETDVDWYPVSKGDLATVMSDPFKYVRNGDGTEELYDLRADRNELWNLANEPHLASVLAQLRKQNSRPRRRP